MTVRKGKRYGTKASAHMAIIQAQEPIRHPTTGDIIGFKNELLAEAALHGGEVEVKGPSGEVLKVANIRGHFIDTGLQAEEKGWTEEEQKRVEDRLDFDCQRLPELIWHIEDVALVAPWPTYDSTHHKSIPSVAQTVGMVAEALAYEKENKNRAEVVEKLTELQAEESAEREAEQSLTAA